MNGKGDKRRPTDTKAFDANYDRIFGKKKEVEICAICGLPITGCVAYQSYHQQ